MKKFSNSGLSLVEVTVAVILFALAAIPIYYGLSYGASTEVDSEKIAIANKILEAFRDEMLNQPWDELDPSYAATDWLEIGADLPNAFNKLLEAQQKYKDFKFVGWVRKAPDSEVDALEFRAEISWTSNGPKRDPEKIFFLKIKR
ncbi:MAG: hypothetical protein Kow0029_06100 [Candidatus Rifleibacteriota bacterium]